MGLPSAALSLASDVLWPRLCPLLNPCSLPLNAARVLRLQALRWWATCWSFGSRSSRSPRRTRAWGMQVSSSGSSSSSTSVRSCWRQCRNF